MKVVELHIFWLHADVGNVGQSTLTLVSPSKHLENEQTSHLLTWMTWGCLSTAFWAPEFWHSLSHTHVTLQHVPKDQDPGLRLLLCPQHLGVRVSKEVEQPIYNEDRSQVANETIKGQLDLYIYSWMALRGIDYWACVFPLEPVWQRWTLHAAITFSVWWVEDASSKAFWTR